MQSRPQLTLFMVMTTLAVISYTCAPALHLRVDITDDCLPPANDAVHFYIFDEKVNENLKEIIARNSGYMQKRTLSFADSLRVLRRQYTSLVQELETVSHRCSTLLSGLPIKYTDNIIPKVVKIQKFGDVWRFWVEFLNEGPETVTGLNITLSFQNDVLIREHPIEITLAPLESKLYKNLQVDLTRNIPLQLQMGTYSGGLDGLLTVIGCSINRVTSDFHNTVLEPQNRITNLKLRMEELGLAYESMLSSYAEMIKATVVDPTNRILENNIAANAFRSQTVIQPDTVLFSELKRGLIYLLVYTNPLDSLQWYQPINLEDDINITLNRWNCNLFFLHEKSLAGRIHALNSSLLAD